MRSQAVRNEYARIAAFRLRRKYGVDGVRHLHVESIATALGIKLVNAHIDGAAAQLLVKKGRPRIIVSDTVTDPAERRFAIAHELGHYLLLHPTPPAEELCVPRPRNPRAQPCGDDDFPARDVEAEADTFASELLMPGEIVRTVCDMLPMTLAAPAELARLCGVPLSASAIRVTQRTSRVCAAVLSHDGQVQWASPSTRFVERLGMVLPAGSRLDPRSVAAQCFDASKPLESAWPRLVPIQAWCDAPEDMFFQEDTMVLRHSGAVLSMLWLTGERPALRYKRNAAVILGPSPRAAAPAVAELSSCLANVAAPLSQ